MKTSEDQGSQSSAALSADTVSLAALVRALLQLGAVLLVALVGMAWLAHARYGMVGVEAAVWAAIICGLSGGAALVSVAWWTRRHAAVAGALSGIFFRTGPPLMAGVLVPQWRPALGHAGFLPLVLGFYLVMLAAETVLSVRMVGSQQSVTQSGTR